MKLFRLKHDINIYSEGYSSILYRGTLYLVNDIGELPIDVDSSYFEEIDIRLTKITKSSEEE